MYYYNQKIYIDLPTLARVIGVKEDSISEGISQKKLSYSTIQSIKAGELGVLDLHPNANLYLYDSLCAVHQLRFEAVYGDMRRYFALQTQLRDFIAVKAKDIDWLVKRGLNHAEVMDVAMGAEVLRFMSQKPQVIKGYGFKSKDGEFIPAMLRQIRDLEVRDKGQLLYRGLQCIRINTVQGMKVKLWAWKKEGLECLVSGKKGNSNALKRDDRVKMAIKLLASRADKPNYVEVHYLYNQLRLGKIELVNPETGEVMIASGDTGKGGWPELTAQSVYNTIQESRAELDYVRLSSLQFQQKYLPHVHRNKPNYALSKLTMDDKVMALDVELVNKKGEKQRAKLWVYLIFDVMSEACVGWAMGMEKNTDLFQQAIRQMFKNLLAWGIEVNPGEVEVEQHIANTQVELLNGLFPNVRFCRGGNPQEKHAEGLIKKVRYQHEKKMLGGDFKGRPFAQKIENRLNQDLKIRALKDWEAFDLAGRIILDYNNNPAKRGGEQSRLAVMQKNINPNLEKFNLASWAYYIGKKIEKTTIQRNQRFFADGRDYHLAGSDILTQLKGYEVQVYILPSTGGSKAYIYQNGVYVGEAYELTSDLKVQTAQVEKSDLDEDNLSRFMEYQASVKKQIKQKAEELKGWEIKSPLVPEGELNTGGEEYTVDEREGNQEGLLEKMRKLRTQELKEYYQKQA
jgi:hypothetical protein